MSDIYSELCLEKLVFDKIEFKRLGMKNDNELEFDIQVAVGRKEKEDLYRVTLTVRGNKEKEYIFEIELSGYFSFVADCTLDDEMKNKMINQNTVAILMPYMRSQITLLTSQPDVDSVVLPTFNITKLVK